MRLAQYQVRTLAIALFLATPVAGNETPANVPVELSFTAATTYDDPFNTVSVDLMVTTPSGKQLKVPMFWAGKNVWKARYASAETGMHRWQTVCNDIDDAGLHGVTGAITVTPYAGGNSLYQHGPPRVANDGRHFAQDDGTPWLWIGDTCWMGLCTRLAWPEDFQRYVADRKQKGFNVIQIVAGLYPDMPAFDARGANEAGFPWTKNYGRIRPEYFDAADTRIRYLVDQGMVPCLVGAWGFHMPWMGEERLEQHWRYLLARYAAYPVTFCVAGEANLPYYLTEGFPFDDRKQVTRWTKVARYVRQTDPYHRLLSIHPTGLGRLSARGSIDDTRLLDFDMLQTGHGDVGSLGPTVDTARWTYAQEPTMPFLNSEVCYEGILDSCDDSVQRLMTWTSLLCGAAGHTYGANGIWQINRRDQPYGTSPNGTDYGQTSWDEALALPGSAQVGLAGRILQRFPWQQLRPLQEAASFEGDTVPVNWGTWIWDPESKSTEHAAVGSRFFRHVFDVRAGRDVDQATLFVACDNNVTIWINDQLVGTQRGWNPSGRLVGIEDLLKPGRNVIAVHGRNMPAPVDKNPAGLLLSLRIEFADGKSESIRSSQDWRVVRQADDSWRKIGFDDSRWQQARSMGPNGAAPWGQVTASYNRYLVPYCAGTADGRLLLVYLPVARQTVVHNLIVGKKYAASWINPIDGRQHSIGPVTVDKAGNWRPPLPPRRRQDWLLVVECR